MPIQNACFCGRLSICRFRTTDLNERQIAASLTDASYFFSGSAACFTTRGTGK